MLEGPGSNSVIESKIPLQEGKPSVHLQGVPSVEAGIDGSAAQLERDVRHDSTSFLILYNILDISKVTGESLVSFEGYVITPRD